jgi:hypothetical protein
MSIEVKDAVFGNVGSIIAFRMGADDARVLQRYFEPRFEEYDLVHMHNRHFVISLTIEGEKAPAFSAISLNLPAIDGDQTDDIIARSRARYASSREVVEHYVGDRYLSAGQPVQSAQAPQPKPTPEVAPSQPIPPPAPPPSPTVVQSSPPPVPQPEKPAPKPVHFSPKTLAQTILSGTVGAHTPSADENFDTVPAKPKRKRTRKRKRKSSAEPVQNSEDSQNIQT